MVRLALTLPLAAAALMLSPQEHDHPAPEKLGTVSFRTSCKPEVQRHFERAVALLQSFSYKAADEAFQQVAAQDPGCAIAHWGSAMTHYHQLWDLPPSPRDTAAAVQELDLADKAERASERERGFIRAARLAFQDAATVPYATRALNYEEAMRQLAAAYPIDVETKVFYALALISNASPADKEHRKQKVAAGLLEPLFQTFPDHPGVPHYLIHACDNQEMAARGLVAARVYAGIAPSAPHALHMPSHIFTRLGLWDDSIRSNLAARNAAQKQGDTGEELHAMDYLVYAYLQLGRDEEAGQVVQQVKAMQNLSVKDFKIGYAATAIPIRYVVERGRWKDAEEIVNPSDGAQPHVVAIAVWARGLGFARSGHSAEADRESETLLHLEDQLRAAGNLYWANQVSVMRREVAAWSAQAANHAEKAAALLRSSADDEDGIEKLPVTPGPIVPARQQLGELFLAQGNGAAAVKAFQTAAAGTPGRRGVQQGQAQAAHSH